MTHETAPDLPPAPESTTEISAAPEAPAAEAAVPAPVEVAPDPEPSAPVPAAEPEPVENFADILSAFEATHTHKPQAAGKQIDATVISLSAEQVFLDVGFKIEGVLPRSAFDDNASAVQPGDVVPVSITGRNEEGYYQLSRFRIAQPRDWSALEEAFAQKLAVAGTVTGVVKGGLTVDIGVRAFLPAGRSGARDAAELEKLVGADITCRITKLEVADENVVVDRRVVLEEQARTDARSRLASLKEGDTITGTVRTLVSYGAFVDLGGVDGLLHIGDIAWTRIAKPDDVLTVGQQIEVRLLKIDAETGKISLGLKQLQPEPWHAAPARYQPGVRVRGTVTRIMPFGAFVELEPGVEGLIHVSEMSWAKRVQHPSEVVQQGSAVEAVVLSIKPEERRIALGLKQTLTDPWSEVAQKFPVGAHVQGAVTRLAPFGAFVQIAEGIEGLVHISEIVADRRLNHPQEVLRVGQAVEAQVLAIDAAKRQVKLSMKQLIPTGFDEYLAEHKPGDQVSGRVVEVSAASALIELGEGIRATCALPAARPEQTASAPKADLSSLTSMLQARWKGSAPASSASPAPLEPGQIRSFKIAKLDAASHTIALELL